VNERQQGGEDVVFGASRIPKGGRRFFSCQRRNAKDAVLTAVRLLGQGMSDVTIVDEVGRAYSVAEFAKFYTQQGA
jgi:hypothetical protein